jgi:release factor glutamine methyltransferase
MPTLDTSKIDRWQAKRQKAFKEIPLDGKTITYLGKKFTVFPNTFWPYQDSQPLIKNFQVNEGDSVLDLGTGSGVIAIFACYKGASKVLAVDVNPAAVKSAKHNAKTHGFEKVMTVKRSNLFDAVGPKKFDVITANLPFRDKAAGDVVAQSQWDTDLQTNKKFFKEVLNYLKPGGRIYFAQSNFGAIPQIKVLAKEAGLSVKTIGTKSDGDKGIKTFYAFVMKRVKENGADE